MTNLEKYKDKSGRELECAFQKFCDANICHKCPVDCVKATHGISRCVVAWLELDDKGRIPTPQWKNNIMDRFTKKEK